MRRSSRLRRQVSGADAYPTLRNLEAGSIVQMFDAKDLQLVWFEVALLTIKPLITQAR
jgi:hypothetical protein